MSYEELLSRVLQESPSLDELNELDEVRELVHDERLLNQGRRTVCPRLARHLVPFAVSACPGFDLGLINLNGADVGQGEREPLAIQVPVFELVMEPLLGRVGLRNGHDGHKLDGKWTGTLRERESASRIAARESDLKPAVFF